MSFDQEKEPYAFKSSQNIEGGTNNGYVKQTARCAV